MKRREILIQQDREDKLWYVQECNLLDLGRFSDLRAAKEFAEFIKEKRESSL